MEQKKNQQLNKKGRTHGGTRGKGQAEVGSRTSRVASLWKVSRSNTPCSTSRTISKAEVIKFWVITSRSLTPARNLQGQGGTEKCECPHLPPNDIPSVLCIRPHVRSVTLDNAGRRGTMLVWIFRTLLGVLKGTLEPRNRPATSPLAFPPLSCSHSLQLAIFLPLPPDPGSPLVSFAHQASLPALVPRLPARPWPQPVSPSLIVVFMPRGVLNI